MHKVVVVKTEELSVDKWVVSFDTDKDIYLPKGMPLLMKDGWKRGDQIAVGDCLFEDTDEWEKKYPLDQACRVIKVKYWPEEELKKFILSSKSIERLRRGASWVRWLSFGHEEGARTVKGDSALELYWADSCRVRTVHWGDSI